MFHILLNWKERLACPLIGRRVSWAVIPMPVLFLLISSIGVFTSTTLVAGVNNPNFIVEQQRDAAVGGSNFTVIGQQTIGSQETCSSVIVTVSGSITGTNNDEGGNDIVSFALWDDGILKDSASIQVAVGATKNFSLTMQFQGLYKTGAPGVGVYAGELGWFVDPFYPKDKYGSCEKFQFSSIAGPVEPNTCVPVHVEAMTADGFIDTAVTGNVTLSVNYGGVSPNILTFTNGVATNNCVKILTEGKNKQLTAQGFGRNGDSGYFDCGGTCFGSVVLLLAPYPDMTAILYNAAGVEVGRQVSLEDPQSTLYMVKFADVPCGGAYRLRVEKDSVYKDNIEIDVTAKGVVKTISLPASGIKGTPVVLIPGIMGSSRPTSQLNGAPLLKNPYPDTGLEFHWSRLTGWDGTQDNLEESGYTVFRCPWDWRNGIGTDDNSPINMEINVKTFLMPVIDEAMRSSTTGKVSIVAHSMGGLLARSYIQSSLYRNDVEKLALVAVPNLGSANPYFLWEAGDIYTGTKIFDDNDSNDGLYGNTVQRLWKVTYDKKNWQKCNTKAICDFVQKRSPSLRQLMYTETVLRKNGKDVAVSAAGHENVWLKALNSGTDGFKNPSDVFSKDSSGTKVKTRVFLGNQASSTLRNIETGSNYFSYPDGTINYPDGIPLDVGPMSCADSEKKKKATNTHIIRSNGDGTVPTESSKYPLTAGWADREENVSGEEHGYIMKGFRKEIVGFLDGSRAGVATEPKTVAKESMTTATTTERVGEISDTQLAFSIIGDAGILVTDSQGRRSGVTIDTHEAVTEIPGTKIDINDMVASLAITNAAAGQYHLTYYGLSEREFSLNISATNVLGEVEEEPFEGFKPEAPQTITVLYNPTSSDQIVVQPVLAAPQGLKAEPYECGAGKCVRLRWKASTGADVAQNVVYRALINTPFYSEFIRLPATTSSYDTGEPWDIVNEIPVNGYAVSAIRDDSVESFFAEEGKKQEGGFLPAILYLLAE